MSRHRPTVFGQLSFWVLFILAMTALTVASLLHLT